MITKQQAEDIAKGALSRRSGSVGRWELTEFGQGWLIDEEQPEGKKLMGRPHRVVERDTGQVVLFPSSVPPDRILHEYPAVRDRGVPEHG